MAREWNATCADCGKAFSYSDETFHEARLRGEPLPEVCPSCALEFLRERRALGRSWSGLTCQMLPGSWSDRAIGHLDLVREPGSSAQFFPQTFEEDRHKFGVSDARLIEFYQKLDDPLVQVILVEAPTGAGKSTFFPFRLLAPPPGVPDPKVFTRNGQIMVTQPRIQATKNIPAYVGKLHGCRIGAGFDIGFRHSKEHAADWRCKLVYLTDGTLINWIASGQLANISLVMLDEAHERSLIIDLIIGLLTKMLPRYPWLKLVIASATIDHEKFLGFFKNHLRGGTRCERIVFEGKPNMPVRKHFRCGHVTWEDALGNTLVGEPEKPEPTLPYDGENLKELLNGLPDEVANKCVELLERMIPSEESRRRGVPDDLVDRRGDVLAFLHGEKPIEEAIAAIRKRVQANPVLKACVDVLPLYTKLSAEDQKKALLPPREGFIRVIISTNVAETSLTLQGIKHVVETGIINRNHWDTATETGVVRKQRHSQSGCRQRWGRAGRVMEGDAWCLYTKDQFDRLFPRDTEPSILGTRLEPAVLSAKIAGVDRLDSEHFPWLDPPPEEELQRALRRLRQFGALDADGDLTPHGAEVQRLGSDPAWASLLILADRFACAVEMATVLPLIDSGGRDRLLLKDRSWDPATRNRAQEIQQALAWGCRDDLELILKVFAAWTEARAGGPLITSSWAWPEIWARAHKPIPEEVREPLGPMADALERRVLAVTEPADFEAITADPAASGLKVQAWLAEAREAFGRAASECWAKLWCVNDLLLRELEKGQDDRIELLAVRKKEKERRPINFEMLDRIRILLVWARPDLCFLRSENQPEENFVLDDEPDDEAQAERRPNFSIGPRYDRLSDRIEANRLTKMASGGSTIENEGNVERQDSLDEAVGAEVELKLGDRTICAGTEPDFLIALGSQVRIAKPHPNSSPRNSVMVSFVVLARPEWFDRVPGMDLMELSLYLTEASPPPPPAAPGDRPEGAVRRRLFIDQRYPIYGQYRYRPLKKRKDQRWEVELIEPVGFWPESRAVAPPRRADETSDEASEESEPETPAGPIELCTDILEVLHNEGGEPQLDPASAPAPDVDDSDEDPDLGEDPDSDSDSDSEPEPEPEPRSEDESRVQARPPAPAFVLPRWRPVQSIVELAQAEAPSEPIAEVVGYEMLGGMEARVEAESAETASADDPSEASVERDLALVLRTPTPGLCFDLFQRRHSVGDRVLLTVVGHAYAPGSAYAELRVRDADSGYEGRVLADDLGFLSLRELADSFPDETQIEMAVDAIDPQRQVVRFSLLPVLEDLHRQVEETHGRSFLAEGRIVEMNKERVQFLIDPTTLVPNLPPTRRVPLTAEVYWPEDRGNIPLLCEPGRKYNLRFEFRGRNQSVPIGEVPENLEPLLESLKQLWGPHFGWDSERRRLGYKPFIRGGRDGSFTKRLDEPLRRAALSLSDHAGFQRAVELLYRRCNTLEALPADFDLEHRYPPGMVVRGEIVELGEPWVDNSIPGRDGILRLDSGLRAGIPREEFREGPPHVVGKLVRATVLEANAARQEIWLTLRTDDRVIHEIRQATLRTVAADLGLLDKSKDITIAHHLSDAERAAIVDRLTAAQQVYPWMGWAVLKVTPEHTAKVIGTGQAARREIEQQTETIVCAARGNVFLLAPGEAQLQDAIEGVRRRMREQFRGEQAIEPGRATAAGGTDPFASLRLEPVGQVAVIPSQTLETGGAKARARQRLGMIFDRLKSLVSG